MITTSETLIREAEKTIDHYHEKFQLFSLPRNIALLHALKCFEDFCRLPPKYEQFSAENYERVIHNNLDMLNIVTMWIFKLCKEDCVSCDTNETLGKYYRYAFKVFSEASKYVGICASYTSWSRKYMDATLDTKKKKLTFTAKYRERQRLNTVDMVFFMKNRTSILDKNDNQLQFIEQKIMDINENLRKSIEIVDNKIIRYKVTPLIWNTYHYLSEITVNEVFELPEDWNFSHFCIRDLKLFWSALLTKALIHNWVCMNAGVDGFGIDNSILVLTSHELSSEIEARTGIGYDKVLEIINFITYNHTIKNIDVVWQPLISLESDKLAIAPHLIINNNAERNIISLINKIDQASYSRLSSKKEDVMAGGLLQKYSLKYPHLLIALKKNLPGRLPDMDLIIYDTNSKVLFIAELKWLLSVASAQEAFAREIDLRKGVSQVSQIREYLIKNVGDCLMRVFGTSDLPVEEILVCVVSKHNTGSVAYDNDISIVSEYALDDLLNKNKGNMKDVLNDIRNDKFHPVIGKDFKFTRRNLDYAGYKISIPMYEILGSSERFIGYGKSPK